MTPLPPRREISARQLAWLRREMARWRAGGLLDEATAAAIADTYVVGRRLPLERLLLLLGAAFVGVGVIWLVAANLEQISPLARFVGVSLVWLAAIVTAEALADRRAGDETRDEDSPVAGAVRLLAVLAYGAVVFQAAQSLQVPAYDATLLGVWGAGALAYAYASGGSAALLVAVAASVGWYVWIVGERADDAAAAAIALLVGGGIAAAAAAVHQRRWRPAFATQWGVVAALLALVGLFIAALPGIAPLDPDLPVVLWVGVGVFAVAAVAAFAATDRGGRADILAMTAMLLAATALLGWSPADASSTRGTVTGGLVVHALLATGTYLGAAAWFATGGVLRESPFLTALATFALVVFVMVQSFAVFEPLLSGAALFLTLGVVFLLTGVLANRGRRRLLARVPEDGQ